ncbi:MAG: non-canonical purine NTP pyrophosphatase [Flavobacteriales bacterium]|nr:MAG: non-canonical purine NTP pyrophosphatase [Flavobacteriales bacterium]
MNLVFATHNKHKIKEVEKIMPKKIKLLSLSDINCHENIPETAGSFVGNARIKARHIYNHYGYNCFADDTGLEVEALKGNPGVYSARYAGENSNDSANRLKLLSEMVNFKNKTAHFKTVICLLLDGNEYLFEGICKGYITEEEKGKNGFGYDSVFVPQGYDCTFAELSLTRKNQISHRAIATNKLATFLNNL